MATNSSLRHYSGFAVSEISIRSRSLAMQCGEARSALAHYIIGAITKSVKQSCPVVSCISPWFNVDTARVGQRHDGEDPRHPRIPSQWRAEVFFCQSQIYRNRVQEKRGSSDLPDIQILLPLHHWSARAVRRTSKSTDCQAGTKHLPNCALIPTTDWWCSTLTKMDAICAVHMLSQFIGIAKLQRECQTSHQ